MHLMRRLNPATPVRAADRDDELIRATASCANEAIDAHVLPGSRQGAAIERVAQRYAKVLGIDARELRKALELGRGGVAAAATKPIETGARG